MKAIKHYLDECITRGIAKNDADIGRQIGVSRGAVHHWRESNAAPAEDAAAKLAEMLGKPEVMAECAAARAKTPEGRRAWEKLARIAAAAAVMLLATPHESNAMSINSAHTERYCFQKRRKPRQRKVWEIVNRTIDFISRLQTSLIAAVQYAGLAFSPRERENSPENARLLQVKTIALRVPPQPREA